jgi:hypothetical protein
MNRQNEMMLFHVATMLMGIFHRNIHTIESHGHFHPPPPAYPLMRPVERIKMSMRPMEVKRLCTPAVYNIRCVLSICNVMFIIKIQIQY